MNFGIVMGAVVLAVGIGGAGYLVGDALIESKQPLRTVTVKGLSERAVEANLGFWPIRFVATGASLEEARTSLEVAETAVNRFLTDRGFAAEEIQVQNVLVEDRAAGYNSSGMQDEYRFVLTEELLVTTDKVQDLATASREVADLLRQGVVFSADAYSAGASFVFTGINDLKSEMLTEATQRAKDTAAQFATESGANVGNIQNANQGVFEILPAVEIPNDRPEKQIDKKVRVVTTITYSLVN
jgi:hypothetical protein